MFQRALGFFVTMKEIMPKKERGLNVLKRTGWTLLGILIVMWAIGFFAPEFTRTMPELSTAWLKEKINAQKEATYNAEIDKIREKFDDSPFT